MSQGVSATLAGTAVLATVAAAAGPAGVAYLPFYALALVPGWLLGGAVFGRGPARWIGGALAGYTLTQLALWACISAGLTAPVWFALAWLAVTVLCWVARSRVDTPLFPMETWGRTDLAALCLVVLLVPLIMGVPYSNIGREDAAGTRYYRAYFTADFVWHTALSAELGKYDMPPRNPYLAAEPLHYYWTYFLLPAVVAESGPPLLRDVQLVLKVNALCNAVLLAAAIFLFARTAVPSAWPAACAVALVLVAASAEGALVLWEIATSGRTLDYVRTINIDAITAWRFDGLRIDGLARSMLYNPQHSLSCALALVAFTGATAAGFNAGAGAVLATGGLLALSTIANPFLGGMFSLIYGASMAADALWRRTAADLRRLAVHALAALPVAAAVAWTDVNQMTEGAAAALTIGWGGDARNAPVATVMFSLGPVLLPALAGLWPSTRLPGLAARLSGCGLIIGLLLMHLVRISDGAWIGFRAGQIMQCLMPALVARFLWRLRERGWGAMLLPSAFILAIGLPTTIIDLYNAQDISNLRPGPGFPWTLTVSPAQREAFGWIRSRTAPDAVVQMDVIARGRAHWSLIPTFAQRRMAAGLPISLLASPRYTRRAEDVQRIYATADAEEAWKTSRSLRIDYLYMDETERKVYPDGVSKFGDAPEQFRRVFTNAEVAIYQVVR
ncbi:MAG TPA: hypothetical protein VD833_00695 [Vicinamibacterales bacterium]|nr:hypothetical protein [Vicinamibacterales bacterium]